MKAKHQTIEFKTDPTTQKKINAINFNRLPEHIQEEVFRRIKLLFRL